MAATSKQEIDANWWQRLVARISSSAAVSRLLAHTLHRIDGPVLRISKGWISPTAVVAGFPIVMLTTIGAKTGRSRTVPLVGIPDGDKIILIASNWGGQHHPAWYHNLRVHPEATLVINGRTSTYVARQASGEERERYWQRALRIYPNYETYKDRTDGREIPVMILTPKENTNP